MNHRSAILVTGGAGYIGAHACRALIAAGYQPIVYDNLSTGHRAFVGGPLVVADLLDKAALARVFCRASDRGGDALCSRAHGWRNPSSIRRNIT
jgi:UDP-glucose 4-epimerase